MQIKDKQGLRSRDLITIAIFSVLFAIIYFIVAMTMGMLPVTYPFITPVTLIPAGIVWTYVRAKIPKRGNILVQSTLTALLMFVIGAGWFISLSLLLGGAAAEIISGAGKYKRTVLNALGYAAFGVIVNFGCFSLILLASDYYYSFSMANGMEAAYMDALMAFMSWPVLLISSTLTVFSAFIGIGLGKVMLKKHFVKAGIA